MTKVMRYYGILHHFHSVFRVFFMCSERQCQLDKVDRVGFTRCNFHLNDVDKVQQGNHSPAARFEKIVIAQRFLYANVFLLLGPVDDHQFTTATANTPKP